MYAQDLKVNLQGDARILLEGMQKNVIRGENINEKLAFNSGTICRRRSEGNTAHHAVGLWVSALWIFILEQFPSLLAKKSAFFPDKLLHEFLGGFLNCRDARDLERQLRKEQEKAKAEKQIRGVVIGWSRNLQLIN